MQIIKYLFTAVALVIATQAFAQGNRNVNWLHGLGDNGSTWDIYRALFNAERCINGQSRTYPSGNGLFDAYTDAFADHNAAFMDDQNPRNVAIGHSLGGIVAREIDRRHPGSDRRFGGIITVGSPNDGAGLVNSGLNGEVTQVIDDACMRLSAGPISSLPMVVNVVVNGFVRDDICNLLEVQVVNPLLTAGTGIFSPTAEDVREGSPHINTLNQYASPTPSLSVWGNENSPVHWRLASSLLSNNANDQVIVDVVNGMRSEYHTQFVVNTTFSVLLGGAGFWNPWLWAVSANHAYRAVSWKRGRDWFDRSEDLWNGLIRCHRWETRSITVTVPNCGSGTPMPRPRDEWERCLNDCQLSGSNCTTTRTQTYRVFVRRPSDGFFCDEVQIIDGLTPSNIYEARGVNHREQTNTTNGTTANGNDEMRDVFNLIWNRSDFFQTNTRAAGC